MSELEAFIARGHRKIIDHYRWLRDTAKSDADLERFQQCMEKEEALLKKSMYQAPQLERTA
jgi:hypothetical protein